MKFLIHYLARTSLAPIHSDVIITGPVHAKAIEHIREALASDARKKTRRVFDADDIIIANIIPLPDGPPGRPEQLDSMLEGES